MGWGVSRTPRYGAGMGVLGLGVPTEVGSVGWGSEGSPDMGGWVGFLGAGFLRWGGGRRDPQIWGWVGGLGAGCPYSGGECGVGVLRIPGCGAGMGVLGQGVLMKRGVWGGGLRDL